MRFKHLQLMAKDWEAMKGMKAKEMYVYIGKLRLCVPVGYGGAGPEVLESTSSRASTPRSARSGRDLRGSEFGVESAAPLPQGMPSPPPRKDPLDGTIPVEPEPGQA